MDNYKYCLSSASKINLDKNIIINEDYIYEINPFVCKCIYNSDWESISEDVITELVSLGLIFRKRTTPHSRVHWSQLCEDLKNTMRNKAVSLSQQGFMNKIVNGEASQEEVNHWILSMFDFTKLAKEHIGYIVDICNRKEEYESKKFWVKFFDEEKNHWKIYSEIFKEMELNIVEEYERPPYHAVRKFVDFLKVAAEKSEAHYAALLFMIEEGPCAETLEQDTQFFSLVKHYGFSYKAVNRLFLHTLLNENIGHSEIWKEVISKRKFYDIDEYEEIISFALEHLELAEYWVDSIERV